MKKSQKQLVKEAFTKTRDEIYQSMSKAEKIGYWLIIASALLAIVSIGS